MEEKSLISEGLELLLSNQQKELRAYDAKATAYISSNAGLFVIALFTLCIFQMVSGEKSWLDSAQAVWWVLLVLTVLYAILFCASNTLCLMVLFPRHHLSFLSRQERKTCENSQAFILDKSITNFNSEKLDEDFDQAITYTLDSLDFIKREHIKTNVKILRKKDYLCRWITPLSILMSIILCALIVLIFVF